jgi:hypothetical protein
MIDELDLLKRDWQKKEVHLPQLTYTDIQQMIWKRSSSIVRWILVISILEFTLPHLVYLLPSVRSGEGFMIYEVLGISKILFVISLVYYLVALYFIFQFYKRFREISVLENSKTLMRKIIKTRRTVKHYVVFALSTIVLFVMVTLVGIYMTDDLAILFPEMADSLKNLDPNKLKTTLLGTIALFGTIFIVLMGAIYFLLYGLLLRKLKQNYQELKKLEF